MNDAVAEGYHEASVSLTASNTDANYQGAQDALAVNVIDNDAPNAIPDAVATDEDTTQTFNLTLNDLDPQGGFFLTVTSISQPAHGVATLNPNGTVTYTPAANWNGQDSFNYTVSNSFGSSNLGMVRENKGVRLDFP